MEVTTSNTTCTYLILIHASISSVHSSQITKMHCFQILCIGCISSQHSMVGIETIKSSKTCSFPRVWILMGEWTGSSVTTMIIPISACYSYELHNANHVSLTRSFSTSESSLNHSNNREYHNIIHLSDRVGWDQEYVIEDARIIPYGGSSRNKIQLEKRLRIGWTTTISPIIIRLKQLITTQ